MLSRETIVRSAQIAEALALVDSAEPVKLSGDLATRTLQYLEALARKRGLLPPLPSEPDLSTITKTIGTSSRDYSTIASWEADLDNSGIYAASDHAVGDCYNDSAFNENPTINGGTTIGLADIVLQGASGQRHTGTAGTGARIVRSGGVDGIQVNVNLSVTVKWLEINMNAQSSSGYGLQRTDTNSTSDYFQNNIIHGLRSTGFDTWGIESAGGPTHITNNIVYDVKNTQTGGFSNRRARGIVSTGTSVRTVANNTIYNVTQSSSSTAHGLLWTDTANITNENNASLDAGNDDFNGGTSGTVNYNCSADTTATGANSLVSKTASNQFVSIVGGSEDLHLKSGADCINAGVDLTTSPTNVQYDIDGRDRDALGDTWDIGADEFVDAGGGHPAMRRFGLSQHFASLRPLGNEGVMVI